MAIIEEVQERMDDAFNAVRREFGSVRTGKATPALLDSVRVDAYGSRLPLNQVGNVTTPEPTLIVIQPFDRSLIGPIERGIQQASLGFNPSNDGQVIRVPVPPLNEERRREYVKLLAQMAEEGRVSIRQARREGNDEVKRQQKEAEVSEDEARRLSDQIQKLTDQYIEKIDGALKAKEKEVMTV
jgi:ribosome recycling factor